MPSRTLLVKFVELNGLIFHARAAKLCAEVNCENEKVGKGGALRSMDRRLIRGFTVVLMRKECKIAE